MATDAEFRIIWSGRLPVSRSSARRAAAAMAATAPGGMRMMPASTATSEADSSVFVWTRIGRSERTKAERKRRPSSAGLTRPSSASRTPSATYGVAARTVSAIRNFAARGSGFMRMPCPRRASLAPARREEGVSGASAGPQPALDEQDRRENRRDHEQLTCPAPVDRRPDDEEHERRRQEHADEDLEQETRTQADGGSVESPGGAARSL